MYYLQELPLALFTLLAQMAVGIVLVGQCVGGCSVDEPTRDRVRRQSLFALVFFGIATVISLLHTGTPQHGPYTALNFTSSWLSREIVMVGITGIGMLWLAVTRLKKGTAAREKWPVALSVVAGLSLIYVMSQVYNQKYMPGWHSPAVFPLFLSSAFMLGAVWHGLALSIGKGSIQEGSTHAGRPVAMWALLGFVLMSASLSLTMPDMTLPMLNPTTVEIPFSCLAWSHALHALLSGLGVMLLVLAGLRAPSTKGLCACLTIPAFVLLAVGEIFGRLVFYLSYSRLGM